MGRMGGVTKEMEEVVEDLKNGQATQKTMEKQQRILTRLLDAQHALKEQDTGRQRQAKAGRNRYRQSPGPLELTPSELKAKLTRDILDLMKEGYSQDYQELIRDYFERLMAEEEASEN